MRVAALALGAAGATTNPVDPVLANRTVRPLEDASHLNGGYDQYKLIGANPPRASTSSMMYALNQIGVKAMHARTMVYTPTDPWSLPQGATYEAIEILELGMQEIGIPQTFFFPDKATDPADIADAKRLRTPEELKRDISDLKQTCKRHVADAASRPAGTRQAINTQKKQKLAAFYKKYGVQSAFDWPAFQSFEDIAELFPHAHIWYATRDFNKFAQSIGRVHDTMNTYMMRLSYNLYPPVTRVMDGSGLSMDLWISKLVEFTQCEDNLLLEAVLHRRWTAIGSAHDTISFLICDPQQRVGNDYWGCKPDERLIARFYEVNAAYSELVLADPLIRDRVTKIDLEQERYSWPKLCAALSIGDADCPQDKFPSSHSDMKNEIMRVQMLGALRVVGLPLVGFCLFMWFMKRQLRKSVVQMQKKRV